MEEDLGKVHLDLENNNNSHHSHHHQHHHQREHKFQEGEEHNDNPLSTSDFKYQLHLVNISINNVYTKWSLFPSHPGEEKCSQYLKTGSCTSGAKCRFDHPIHEPVRASIENDLLLFLTFITERLMKILKTFSYEAAVDVLSSLCKIVTLLEFYYEIALTHPSYGQICYLYGDVIIRLSVDIDNFCSNKLSQRRTTPRFKRKGPQLLDSNFHVFEDCAARLEALNQKWLDWEEDIRLETVNQLQEENNPAVIHITNKLSSIMLEYAHETLTQLESIRMIREEIRLQLLTQFRQYPHWSSINLDLLPFGSHANYLSTHESDLDLTLQFPNGGAGMEPIDVLEIAGSLATAVGFHLRELVKETRVPFLKLYDEKNQIEIDIVVNNNLAIYNTTLLKNYALIDSRVRPLVLAIKKWAHCRGCNNPKNATLSSYAWTLMVLYFLMTHTTELPSIEDVGKIVEERQLNLETMLNDLTELRRLPTTTHSIGKLLIQFFAFYGTCSPHGFQPFHSIISLRNTFRVYKKSSHFHTGVRTKSVGEVLIDRLGLLQAAKVVSNELIGEADTARSEVNEISNMVVYSLSPSWRFCIEDPYEEHDLGNVIFCLTGQIHLMDEMKRCLTLFNDLIVKHRYHFQDLQIDDLSGILLPEQFNYWNILSTVNHSVPIATKTCSLCGQEGHFSKECDLVRCHLCNEKGHFLKDCIKLFCSNCRQQGHFAKDCKKERLCRYCKQPGHDVRDCPFKICNRCGSKNHTTFRCKIKSNDSHGNQQHQQQQLHQQLHQQEEELQQVHQEGQHLEGESSHPHPYPAEEKIQSTLSGKSSVDVTKNLPRRGKVPPLPLEAKRNSMAKLANLRQSIKIVPPDSPLVLSHDEFMDSPDSKISYNPQELSQLTPEEIPSPEQQQSQFQNQQVEKKKKKRKPRNKSNIIEKSNESVLSTESPEGSPLINDFTKHHNIHLDTSSTNSSPRDVVSHRKKYEAGANGGGGGISPSRSLGQTTSVRLAHAIRNPITRASSIEEKKEIKTSVHFESEENEIRVVPADSKIEDSPIETSPDMKRAAPKLDQIRPRRPQNKQQHPSDSKYISLTRPPSQLLTHRTQIDISCSDLSDFGMETHTSFETQNQIIESKKSSKIKKESKHVSYQTRGLVCDETQESNTLDPDSSAEMTSRKKNIFRRESKIVETKFTDP